MKTRTELDSTYCMNEYEFEEVLEILLDAIGWKREFLGAKVLLSVVQDIARELWVQQILETEGSMALRYQLQAYSRNGTFDLYPWESPVS